MGVRVRVWLHIDPTINNNNAFEFELHPTPKTVDNTDELWMTWIGTRSYVRSNTRITVKIKYRKSLSDLLRAPLTNSGYRLNWHDRNEGLLITHKVPYSSRQEGRKKAAAWTSSSSIRAGWVLYLSTLQKRRVPLSLWAHSQQWIETKLYVRELCTKVPVSICRPLNNVRIPTSSSRTSIPISLQSHYAIPYPIASSPSLSSVKIMLNTHFEFFMPRCHAISLHSRKVDEGDDDARKKSFHHYPSSACL